jgi:hypothetical protein
MIEFIVGLVVGAILGVIADRIWERFEKRPRIQMTMGYFENREHEKGLRYTVRNIGFSEVPDFEIVLWHPNRGTMSAFSSKQSGPLLPDQSRNYQCVLVQNGYPEPFLKRWISHEKGQHVLEPVFDQFKLLVKMQNSDRVLFESTKMGIAVAKDWYRSLVLNKPGSSTWSDHHAMSSPPPFGLKYWLERRREKKDFQKAIGQHKQPDSNPMDRSERSNPS